MKQSEMTFDELYELPTECNHIYELSNKGFENLLDYFCNNANFIYIGDSLNIDKVLLLFKDHKVIRMMNKGLYGYLRLGYVITVSNKTTDIVKMFIDSFQSQLYIEDLHFIRDGKIVMSSISHEGMLNVHVESTELKVIKSLDGIEVCDYCY
jgi:hypothetical protein